MAEAIAFDLAAELITKLSSFTLSQIGLWWNVKDDLDDLKSTVSTIKAVLLDAEERSVTSQLVKDWLEKLRDVLYDADDLLDDFSTEALGKDLLGGNKLTKEVRLFFSSSNQFAYGLKMGRKMKAIKARLISIGSEAKVFNLVERDRPAETSFMTKKRQQTHSFEREDEIIGRDDDKAALLKLVLESESEENVSFIPIVGFGGLGKTALAQLVYNHERVKNHFELKMFACVSDDFDVKVIVANIIKSVTDLAPDQNLEMDQLQKQLRHKIDGKKYLLVLDDIWNEDPGKWYSLKKLLMGGAKGSRIIVTTRSLRVAEITNKCESHVLKLKGLSDNDAWSLFKRIAFEQGYVDSTSSAFVEVGKQILERCGGVPLAIRTIAGTLSLKKTVNEWHSFKEIELAKISQIEGDILPTLKLSFDHLPSHLKHCFAYCRLYPKDHEIDVRTLVQFWIAQGFVKQLNPSQSLEEIGFGYFKDLVERSFFQELVEYGNGDMICKMHDLMHDLAESVAGMESSIIDSNKISSDVGEKCRHISINPSLIPLFKGKKLRTLLRSPNMGTQNLSQETWDFVIANCRCLRVLKLNGLDFENISPSIYKLKHLRYLDLSWNPHIKNLPKSICKIQNLKALKLDWCDRLQELPKKIERLVNLTHLLCHCCYGLTHMPRGIGKLTSLEKLSAFVVDKDGSHGSADLSELRLLNNLRGELTIRNLGFVKNAKEKFKAANFKEKQHLRSLALLWDGGNDDDDEKSLEDLQPHPNLKELCIEGWRGDAKFPSWLSLHTNLVRIAILGGNFKNLPSFAQLPCLENLEITDLTELEYMDDNNPKGSQGEPQLFFPSLKHLSLWDCPNMKSWWRTTKPNDDDPNEDDATVMGTSTMAFPCLSSLFIENCPLTSMPLYPSLDYVLTLWNTSSRPLKQTIKMNINAKAPSTSTSSLPLSKLKSFHVDNIEGLDTHTLDECLQHLTGLKNLEIRDCKEVDLEGMQWEPLKNLSRLVIDNVPKLVSLPIGLQHLVQLKTLEIENCSGLRSLFPVFQHLTFLEGFSVSNCKELELSAAGIQIFQNYTSLCSLSLGNIPESRHLPELLQHLTNLQELDLIDLPNLTSLPDEMRCLTNLQMLQIIGNPQLKERCRRDIGTDWHKIAHIPEVIINGLIQ
ncbi:hypothetical protein ES319_A11G349800v1 [Gossypium barbadense]|uniref:Rx N-terminal domain-containing protein n=1 Tax=Gossypium barbadense TaxID=3634 RepID=A0A5J5U1C1_GOSBA|nr:hypothetical protein ES319_A11G349800v1 [Gossypium barbadense]KAB2060030.1 hypothetical protein ES319_A11G349800v1 [Gossypium barbadense]KAB2060031.1 hypothetical protein ES319_A11G349800v1 [Gossypium barbadense]KAB2060032.1 hypothetical protein ES319_A11G349800v1 [Gossypium barbadense]